MVRRLDRQPDDAVSDLLRAVQVRSTVYCVSDLSAPWGFEVEDSTAAKFHLVLEGSCVLTLTSGEQVWLEFRAQRSANAAGAVSVDQLDRCIALFARNLQFMLHTQARLLHVRHAFFQVYHFHKSRFSRHARKHTADYGDSAAWKWHLAVAVRWLLSRTAAEQIPRIRQRSCWMRLERGLGSE